MILFPQFGSVVTQPRDEYKSGEDTVVVKFRSANPRNNQRIEGTFLTVERLLDDGTWKVKFTDGDWCTKFHWDGSESYLGISYASISWDIPLEMQGHYRICHFGARKRLASEAEAALLEAPDWMTWNAFGSAVAGMLVNSLQISVSIARKLRGHSPTGWKHRMEEFSGCSKTFFVN